MRDTIFNLKTFGAVGDGVTMETRALQAAIDTCHAAGGGVVRIPAGRYLLGTVLLKSHVTLSLDFGAYLLGSQDLNDYPTEHLRPAREGQAQCLFYAEDAVDIRFEGLGEIDGRGKRDVWPRKVGPGGRDLRPRLIRMENCERLTFSGLCYRDPVFWGIHLVDCRDVVFTAVTIRFRDNHANNDGIDLDGCEHVLIENCDINSGDDAICLKSSLNPCRDIVVRNCVASSATAAVKFGASSSGGFIDVHVSNCHFYDCPMGAIKLELVDGGRLENVTLSRIVMENVGSPLFVRLGNRGKVYTANRRDRSGKRRGPSDKGSDAIPQGAPIGSLKNVRITDVVAEVKGEDKARQAAMMITGIPDACVEDIVLENVTVSFPGGGTAEDAAREVPEDIARYPEQFFFGVLPAWGAYIRHAKNIQFKNVSLRTRNDDARQQIVLDDVTGFQEI